MRVRVILAFLLFVASACSSGPFEQAQRRVRIGMPRDQAVVMLRAEAWYHQPCMDGDIIKDLFFYGSQQYEAAEIVIMTSEKKGETYQVARVGTFDEPNEWQAAYGYCIDRSRFEH